MKEFAETSPNTGYEPKELIPIVARLSRKMTGAESTSIPYEKAQQLMEAVLYCIREWEDRQGEVSLLQEEVNLIPSQPQLTAEQAYEQGYALVLEKVRKALALHNRLVERFDSYGNVYLHDTVLRDLPEFFKWYDPRFAPQDTLITLDYPVGKDLSGHTGIDAVWEYLNCIYEEQCFLSRLDRNFVLEVLREDCPDYEEAIENIRTVVEGYCKSNTSP